MKVIAKGQKVDTCSCGWKLPKEVALLPAGLVKAFLTPVTATIKGSIEGIACVCPSCGAVHTYPDADIVR
jgi:hypothetical protein